VVHNAPILLYGIPSFSCDLPRFTAEPHRKTSHEPDTPPEYVEITAKTRLLRRTVPVARLRQPQDSRLEHEIGCSLPIGLSLLASQRPMHRISVRTSQTPSDSTDIRL
jgi:hypothetical protein